MSKQYSYEIYFADADQHFSGTWDQQERITQIANFSGKRTVTLSKSKESRIVINSDQIAYIVYWPIKEE